MNEQEINQETNSHTEEPAGEDHTAGEAATLLIVDDNVAEAAACRQILENAGYHVLLARDGGQGLEVLRTNPRGIDLVILDWILPSMSGDQWLEYYLEIVPDLKVVFCSGKFISEVVLEQLGLDRQGFLKKPFTAAELLETAKNALHGDSSRLADPRASS